MKEFNLAYSQTTTPPQEVVSLSSRPSPRIDGDVLYNGTLRHAVLLTIDASSGTILGNIQINPYPVAILTISPMVDDGSIFIGVSNDEEKWPSPSRDTHVVPLSVM